MRKSTRRRHSEDLGEPEMLPMMNVLFILVLVLMGMSTFMPLGAISTEAPRLAGAGEESNNSEPKRELNLVVILQPDGINLSLAGILESGPNGPLFPKIEGKKGSIYDFAALNQRLMQIKQQYPSETRIMIMADPDVIYDDIIQTMDAARRSEDKKIMFPEVAFIPGMLE